MSDDLHDRVNRLLDEAATKFESLPDPDDADSLAERVEEDGLGELASDASELLENTDSQELLNALELGGDEGEATSIPIAIATGDPERVRDLRALLKLSKLPAEGEEGEFDDGEREQTLEALGEALGERTGGGQGSPGASEEGGGEGEPAENGDSEAGGETDEDDGTGAEDGDGAETDDEPEPADGGSESEGDEEDSGEESSGEAIRSAMSSALEGVRDELQSAGGDGDLFGEGGAGDEDETGDEDATDEEDEESSSDDGDEGEEADESEEEDGLLGGDGDLLGGTGSGSSGRRGRLSTMPRQDRADMRGVVRHSTMPDR